MRKLHEYKIAGGISVLLRKSRVSGLRKGSAAIRNIGGIEATIDFREPLCGCEVHVIRFLAYQTDINNARYMLQHRAQL